MKRQEKLISVALVVFLFMVVQMVTNPRDRSISAKTVTVGENTPGLLPDEVRVVPTRCEIPPVLLLEVAGVLSPYAGQLAIRKKEKGKSMEPLNNIQWMRKEWFSDFICKNEAPLSVCSIPSSYDWESKTVYLNYDLVAFADESTVCAEIFKVAVKHIQFELGLDKKVGKKVREKDIQATISLFSRLYQKGGVQGLKNAVESWERRIALQ